MAALHPGLAPWTVKEPNSEHGGEEMEEGSPDIISKYTLRTCAGVTEMSGEEELASSLSPWMKVEACFFPHS